MTKLQTTPPSAAVSARVRQFVRVKPASRLAQDWTMPPGALGTVLCRYRILGKPAVSSERLDVRFDAQTILWGCPADEFDMISDASEQMRN